ncbi:MAG TPA: hypothetical protein VFV39_07930, partial [Limnobacter sp.]|nr:hypothetical protein [Limnobacter sp.]
MAEVSMWRGVCQAGLLGLGMHTSMASAVELGAMEVRSEVGMPLIAHVQFDMSPQEAQQPEQLSIAVKSTSVADFKGLVRTRVFLQPNSTSGFLRITAIEPAPRGLALVLEARDPRQNHIREYVIDNNAVRTRDLQRPELPKPVSPPPPPAAVDFPAEPSQVLEPAPPDGIELRLLDQTQGDEVVSPRALASDLALLNKTQAALLDDEKARTQAAEAIALLAVLGQDARSLFGVKASRDVVLAAMEEGMKVEPDDYVLTIRGDQLDERGNLQTAPATVGKPEEVEPPPAASAQPQPLTPPQAPVPRDEGGMGTLTWMLLSVVSIALGLLFWFTTRLREQANRQTPAESETDDLQTATPAPVQARAEPVLMGDALALPEPASPAQEPDKEWLSAQEEPNFDMESSPPFVGTEPSLA